MFLGKLFKKDHQHYLTRGGKHLAAERYADARIDFQEALKCCPADAQTVQDEIRAKLTLAGDRLGELNLQEGERSVNSGDLAKAADHFTLACELAFDETIRAMAREGLKKLDQAPAAAKRPAESHQHGQGGGSCGSGGHSHGGCGSSGHSHGGGGCGCGGGEHGAQEEIPEPDFSDDERFSILVHTLPGDLPERYAALGERFAQAYLLINDGNDGQAFPILREMLVSGDNDIVIYEVALIMYRAGKLHEADGLLKRALEANPHNPLCYLTLVHLLAEMGRLVESIATVERMMELGILADQAQLMLGDLRHASGDQEAAFQAWSKALELPTMAKAAAERLVPVLEGQGRLEEAKFLTKSYLKGCH